MPTLTFGSIHAFVATLEIELDLLRRQAARERLLRAYEAGRARPRGTDRPSWRRQKPGAPHLRGAH